MSDKLLKFRDLVLREDFKAAYPLGTELLNSDPESPEILYLMGHMYRAMGNLGVALPMLAKSLAKEKKQPNLWMTYAATLHDLNRWEEAEQGFLVVHNMLPTDPMPMANIGATYIQRGMWRDAINWCDKALALEPDNHIARISKGFGCLSLGRWKDAWEYSEALYGNHLQIRVYSPTGEAEPEWDGSKGKTVVVQCDQGVGDQIMFSQCLKQMIEDCKLVIVETSKRMVPYFQHNFPGCHVYGTLKDAQVDWTKDYEIEARISLSGLGKFYRNLDRDFPRLPYIAPEPKALAGWKEWLAQFPKPWIGVSWKGGIQATQRHIRSVNLADLGPVMKQPGTYVDLSYMDNGLEISRWNLANPQQIVRPPVDVADYEDTIALLAALDEVVTVTTSIVHACGALGRSCHVLVPEVAQWRYAYRYGDGTKMIWYPDAVHLYRQKPGEDWSHAINRVAKALTTDLKKAA
jgi:tetratricopeptide (TPR) repeat protein